MENAGQIKEALLSILKPIRRANWKVVFFCLSTAAIFWFFNALNKVYTTKIDYPFSIGIDRDSLVFVNRPPSAIPVNVTGGGWQLLKRTVSAKNNPIVITPENPVITKFFTAANMLPQVSNQLSDLNINYLAFDTIFFSIEPQVKKRLAIDLDSASINLMENFYITSSILVEPDSVEFEGPASLINRLPSVFIVSLSDRNIDSRYNVELSLDLFLPALVRKVPEGIHVRFEVEEFLTQKAVLPIGRVNFPYDSEIDLKQNTMEVQFKVQRSFRNRFKKEDIILVADLDEWQKTDSTVAVQVMDLPPYIKDFSLATDRVKVVYE